MTREQVSRLREYSMGRCAGDVADILQKADRVCANTFLFTRRWDMEPTSVPVTFAGSIRWDHVEGQDREWPVVLARQSYLCDVVLAYLVTGQQSYLRCFTRVVEEFLDNCPQDDPAYDNSWRTLDVGIRATVWVRCLDWLEPLDVLEPAFVERVLAALRQHFDLLYRCMDNYHLLSNWGVLANSGAVHAGYRLMAAGEDLSGPIAVLWDRLRRQIEIQVLDDGVQWEQSPMYHHEVLWCCLELLHLADRVHAELDETMVEKIHAMCLATLGEAKPNHHQPMRGDSDDTDVRDILTYGAWLFRDPHLKAGAYQIPDLETAWRMGMDGVRRYEELPVAGLPARGAAFAHSGNYYFRAGQGESAAWVRFRCGPLGSGHGHADLLHLDVTAGGVDILTDTGRLTYVNDSRRTGLKSPAAHNTFCIDGEDFTDCCASWRFGAIAKPIKGEYREDDRFGYVSGMHLGYADRGLFVRREVVFLKPGVLVVFDSFFGTGGHTCRQTFHFGPGNAVLTEDGARFAQNGVGARIQSFAPQPVLHLAETCYSPRYNVRQQTSCLSVESRFGEPSGILTVIGFGEGAEFTARKLPVTQALDGTLLCDSDAQAMEVRCGRQRWTVLFSRREIIGKVNLLCAGTACGYGEAIVFDGEDNPCVMSW